MNTAMEQDHFNPRREDRQARTRLLLWYGVTGSVIAWMAHLVISWGLVSVICDHGGAIWLHLTTIVCLLVALGGWASAWSIRQGADPGQREQRAVESDRFMGTLGITISSLLIGLIVLESIGTFVLDTCR